MLLTGASGGLGKAIARGLAARGCSLILTDLGGAELDRLSEQIGAERIEADLSTRGGVHELAAAAGDVDVLVANAGLPGAGRLDTYEPEEIDRVLDVNLRAPILLARELTPAMVERGRGHVVLISSMAAKFVSPASSLYSASKAGLRAFAAGLRQDFHGTGVGVSAVLPGAISGEGMWVDGGASPPPGIRLRTPSDVATGVTRAIERDRGEVGIADLTSRALGTIGQLAPELAARINRRAGAHEIAEQISAAHLQAGNR